LGKNSFTGTDVKRLLKAVRKAGEIPDKVWVHRADGKTTLEIKIKNDAAADTAIAAPDADTWADVA
jgi:hypothetical protein